MARRLIGITGGFRRRKSQQADEFYVLADYFDSVELAGGVPVLIPQIRGGEALRDLLGRLDGLVITGGPDTPPARYRQQPHPKTKPVHERRDEFDFRCLETALDLRLPILGICYGAQLLNVFLGGTLIQDILPRDRRPTGTFRTGRGCFTRCGSSQARSWRGVSAWRRSRRIPRTTRRWTGSGADCAFRRGAATGLSRESRRRTAASSSECSGTPRNWPRNALTT